jgi:hypothetical protein
LNWIHHERRRSATWTSRAAILQSRIDERQGNDFRRWPRALQFTECVQMGAAFEFPVTGRKDLMDYRVTVDLIFRY